MRFFSLLLLLTCCSGMRTINEDELEIETDNDNINDELEYWPAPINWNHWLTCKNLCGKNLTDVVALTKETDSDHLLCFCKDGRIFKVKQLKGLTIPSTRKGKQTYAR